MEKSYITNKWSASKPIIRYSFVLAVVAVVALPGILFYSMSHQKQSVLFSDLNPSDSAKIISHLEKDKIGYDLDPSGSRILVNESDVHQTRLKLMGEGLAINGGVGFELFDNSEFGMTEFAQRINFQRALQGELTRTIMALDEVRFARVHLVLPDSSLFSSNQSSPSASVTLFLHDGASIAKNQVLGIQKLISSSVEKLQHNMVTVSNEKGDILSNNDGNNDGIETIDSQLEKKREIEAYLSNKANKVLESAIGEDKVVVIVDATINFNRMTKTKEGVIPNQSSTDGIIRKRQTNSSIAKAKKDKPGNSTTEIEYKLGKEVEQLVESPGRISRLSVAVLIKDNQQVDNLNKIEELVSMSIGLDLERGDKISVHHIESVDTLSVSTVSLSDNKIAKQTAIENQVVGVTDKSNIDSDEVNQTKENAYLHIQSIISNPVYFFILSASISLLFFSILSFLYFKYQKTTEDKQTPLTDAQKEIILLRLQEWVAGESINDRQEQKAL